MRARWGRLHHWHPPAPPWKWQPSTEASWFDDAGLTACETHEAIGVAHKTLPCGTRVRICAGADSRGRPVRGAPCEVAIVEDRGPFIAGRELDLNPAARDAIGCDTCTVAWAVR